MRGEVSGQSQLLGLVDPNSLIPPNHPLRRIKILADSALAGCHDTFETMYAEKGRPSIPPERLLKAQLLLALFSLRSERQLCEQIRYNFLFRWFLDLSLVDEVFDPTVFTKNRDRLLKHAVAEELFLGIVGEAEAENLLSHEHFSVDGSLIEAAASLKSLRRRDGEPPKKDDDDPGNPSIDFHGEKRSNATHVSSTDPEARLAKKGKGKEAKLSFMLHTLMENRTGLLLDMVLTIATGTAEREAAITLLDRNHTTGKRATLGTDKSYDTKDFVKACRERKVTPHVASKKRYSAVDGRTTRHGGYKVSQKKRKQIEEGFGWLKTVGGLRKSRFIGVAKTEMQATLAAAAYNLVRLAKLLGPPGLDGAVMRAA